MDPKSVIHKTMLDTQVGAQKKHVEQTSMGATDSAAADNVLVPGRVYKGVVVTVDPSSRTMTVLTRGQMLVNCIFAAGSLASFFGVDMVCMPPLGSDVLIAFLGKTSPPVVVSTLGSLYSTPKKARSTIAGSREDPAGKQEAFKVGQAEKTVKIQNNIPLPQDMVAGELEMNSGLGPTIRLLQNFAQLSASDAAKIETHIYNDMVRIVDNYFVHHSCGGDELIWELSGTCTKEEHFSGYLYEAEGKKAVDDPLMEEEVGKMCYDPVKSVENPYSDTGRWRLSQYYGFLGDMIHRWVTTPTAVESNIMEKAFRAGQYRSWVGNDGTLCIQSAGGVQIEVTQTIVIPAILKSWNDPEFNMAKALQELDGEFLKIWGKGPDWEDMLVAVWQLRYYSKYISLWHSLARFRQLKQHGYCDIPAEADIPERIPTAGEGDKTQANPAGATTMPLYGHAILSMDNAGSIALVSQENTSIVMSNGGIQIACPGNLELKAGGTVSIQGKYMSLRSAGIMEIVSLFGTMVLKARTGLKALCEAGLVWLKGDTSKDRVENFVTDNEIFPDIKPEFRNYSVVIDAAEGSTLVHGATGVTVGCTEEGSNVHLHALGKDSGVTIEAQKEIRILAVAGSIYHKCVDWICDAVNAGFYGQMIKLGLTAVIQKGVLHARAIYSDMMAAYFSVIGRSEHISKVEQDKLEKYKPELTTPELDDEVQTLRDGYQEHIKYDTFVQAEFAKDDSIFEMNSWPDNAFSEDPLAMVSLKRSFFDEFSHTKDQKPKFAFYKPTDHTMMVMSAKRTKPTAAFPGTTHKWVEFKEDPDEKRLGSPWSEDFTASDIKGLSDMRPAVYTYTFLR